MVPMNRDRRRGECGSLSFKGEMAERSNAAVLKTVDLYTRIRGFESLFLRQSLNLSRDSGIFYFSEAPEKACFQKELRENK